MKSETTVKEYKAIPAAKDIIPDTHSNQLLYPIVSPQFVVKDWFSDATYRYQESDTQENIIENNWVCYPGSADIRTSVLSEFKTENNHHFLTLDVDAGFETPLCSREPNLQFIDPYQDQVTLQIKPPPELTNLYSYKGTLTGANSNKVSKIRRSSKLHSYEARIGVTQTFLSSVHQDGKSLAELDLYDFELISLADKTTTFYKGCMQKCYDPTGNPMRYSADDPDIAMHNYRTLPNQLSQPPNLAKGGLRVASSQRYLLPNNINGKELHFTFEITQSLRAMSIWRIFANHHFSNKVKVEFNFSIKIQEDAQKPHERSLITRYGFFQKEHLVSHQLTEAWGMIDRTIEKFRLPL